jgi:hypothetical protein
LLVMAILSFTLSPDAINKLHDALVCLGKFSEAVSIEASGDKVSDFRFIWTTMLTGFCGIVGFDST